MTIHSAKETGQQKEQWGFGLVVTGKWGKGWGWRKFEKWGWRKFEKWGEVGNIGRQGGGGSSKNRGPAHSSANYVKRLQKLPISPIIKPALQFLVSPPRFLVSSPFWVKMSNPPPLQLFLKSFIPPTIFMRGGGGVRTMLRWSISWEQPIPFQSYKIC